MQKTSFWMRVGDWFKHPARNAAFAPAWNQDVQKIESSVVNNGHEPKRPSNGADSNGLLEVPARQRRAEPRVVDDRFAKVESLVDSLQQHFTVQDARSELIAHSLERLAASLGHIPEVSRAQLEILASVRDGLEAQAGRGRRMEESLSQLPQLADAQRETMASIGRQLDVSRQASERSTDVLDRFQQAVSSLGNATTASAAALRQLHVETGEKEQRMMLVLEQQTKRFTFFACVAIGAALVAAMMGLAAALAN